MYTHNVFNNVFIQGKGVAGLNLQLFDEQSDALTAELMVDVPPLRAVL